jgi:beta-fructofuranosidase
MESSAVVAQGTTSPLLPYAYAPLPSSADDARENQSSGGGVRWRACAASALVVLLVVVGFFAGGRVDLGQDGEVSATSSVPGSSRGKDSGVSEKESPADGGFPWSNAMLQWQHTGFHFQPLKHYMNGTFAVGFPDSDLHLLRPWLT